MILENVYNGKLKKADYNYTQSMIFNYANICVWYHRWRFDLKTYFKNHCFKICMQCLTLCLGRLFLASVWSLEVMQCKARVNM